MNPKPDRSDPDRGEAGAEREGQGHDEHATRPSQLPPPDPPSVALPHATDADPDAQQPEADSTSVSLPEETVRSDTAASSGNDQPTSQFIPTEFRPEAQLDSQETTRFAPNVAAQQAAREFLRAKKQPWTKIGRFVVVRELGAGAFGKVFLAEDQQLDRQVAVKVAKAGAFQNDEDRERFLREARAAAQLRHPHIVPVYEYGEHEETSYIAYEFIEGTTLRHLLRDQPIIPVESAVDLMIKIASALDYAHENGIVHRDVKPENILLDKSHQPHVADFGCARQDDTNVLLTMEGAVMGTPAYMSPEQASGSSHLADRRSDVWSLGVIMNELLTGERPFKGNITEILLSIRSREPRPIRQFDSSLPKDLETIVQRCMAKEPVQRFQTAGQLVDELQRWQRGEPIESRPINLFARTWRWAKRNPQVAGLLSAVLLTLALLAGGAWWSRAIVVRQQNENALQAVDSLETAASQVVPTIVATLDRGPNQRRVIETLRQRWHGADTSPRNKARYGLALVAMDPDRYREEALPFLMQRMLNEEDPREFRALRDALQNEPDWFLQGEGDLWRIAENVEALEQTRIRAYAALATFDPQSARWPAASDVVAELVLSDPYQNEWFDALEPISDHLRGELRQRFLSGDENAAAAIAQLFPDDLPLLTELLATASEAQLEHLLSALNPQALPLIDEALDRLALPDSSPAKDHAMQVDQAAIGLANLLIAKFELEQPEPLLSQLDQDRQPDVRTEIIERLADAGIDLQLMRRSIAQLQAADQSARLMSLLLALGEFSLAPTRLESMKQDVVEIYRSHPDPGVHSAAEWLLGRWGFDQEARQAMTDLPDSSSPRGWRVLPTGQTMVALGPVESALIGSTHDERRRYDVADTDDEQRHHRRINRRFEVATRHVTVSEFLQFMEGARARLEEELSRVEGDPARAEDLRAAISYYGGLAQAVAEQQPDHPVQDISWFDAISYCRWFSEQQGVPEDQQCYRPLLELATREAFSEADVAAGQVSKTGFRLPTAGEWEYACRGLAETTWPCGDSPAHLGKYAWIGQPQLSPTLPAGTLKPNRFGLYDILGNVSHWCNSRWVPYPSTDETVDDPLELANAEQYRNREIRGGDVETLASQARPAARWYQDPDEILPHNGFRLFRTIEVGGSGEKAAD